MEILKIKWRGELIGELIDLIPDMWYLEGQWRSYGSDLSNKFEALVGSFDPKAVMTSPEKGTRIEIIENNSKPMHALAISLDNSLLFIRRVSMEKAIEWLINNVD